MAGKTRNLKVAATARLKQQLGTVLLTSLASLGARVLGFYANMIISYHNFTVS